jgi:Kef-type K+ transport system membrane component KefB
MLISICYKFDIYCRGYALSESLEFELIALVFGLFLLPRLIERWYIPSAITAFAFGILFSAFDMPILKDSTVHFLSVLGISALFLLAGVDVDFKEIKRVKKAILLHLCLRVVLILVTTLICSKWLGLSLSVAGLVAVGIVTPSAGFILDTLNSLPLSENQRFWVKTKAISAEILALTVMFFLMQSSSLKTLAFSTAILVIILLLLPSIFRFFAKFVTSHAKNSEFSLFIILAVVLGMVTKKLGLYYLLGAFVVGVAVKRFEDEFPQMHLERLILALKLFCSFFIPFYFFKAGGGVPIEVFNWSSVAVGGVLVAVVLPIRVGIIVLQRYIQFKETWQESFPIALALTPTLVFGLVVAGILKVSFGISDALYGGMLIYTISATIIPGLILRNAGFDDVVEPYEIMEMYSNNQPAKI